MPLYVHKIKYIKINFTICKMFIYMSLLHVFNQSDSEIPLLHTCNNGDVNGQFTMGKIDFYI